MLARGMLNGVGTRIYFADESEANGEDVTLRSLPDDADRATLVAQSSGDGYRFDIVLQGDHETVFVAV